MLSQRFILQCWFDVVGNILFVDLSAYMQVQFQMCSRIDLALKPLGCNCFCNFQFNFLSRKWSKTTDRIFQLGAPLKLWHASIAGSPIKTNGMPALLAHQVPVYTWHVLVYVHMYHISKNYPIYVYLSKTFLRGLWDLPEPWIVLIYCDHLEYSICCLRNLRYSICWILNIRYHICICMIKDSMLPIYLSIYLSICLSIYLSTYLSIYLSVYLSIYLSIDPSIYRSIGLSIYRSVALSLYRSIYLSIHPSIYLSTYLSKQRCTSKLALGNGLLHRAHGGWWSRHRAPWAWRAFFFSPKRSTFEDCLRWY